MAKDDTSVESLKIILLCAAWYCFSSGNNVVGKIVLSDFPYPMTVTMVQLLSISLYVLPIMRLWNVPARQPLSTMYWLKMILPLAFGKFFSSVSSHISIWKVPVSYAHTVKATMPLFVVILSRILLGEKQTKRVYMALVPIVGGVVVATLTEISFNVIGLVSALSATLGFALQNIFSKQCLKETRMHHFQLLLLLARLCAVLFAPLWLWYDGITIFQDTSLWQSYHTPRIIALLLIDGFCNFAQNLIAFTIIAMITPLSYAVANAAKRIVIVSVSLLTLKNPVTTFNLVGMLTAILGVLLYNKAKYDQNKERKRQAILPLIKSAKNLNGMANGDYNMRKSHSNVLLNIPNEEMQQRTTLLAPSSPIYQNNNNDSVNNYNNYDKYSYSQKNNNKNNTSSYRMSADSSKTFYI